MVKRFLAFLIICALGVMPVISQEKKGEVKRRAVRLTEKERKAIKWLVSVQKSNGGWSSDFSVRGRDDGEGTVDVATTCIVTLALFYAGNTPTQGKYKENVLKGINFVLNEIERFADDDSPYVTDTHRRYTQPRSKLGTFIDTYSAPILLSKIHGKMPDEKSNQRVKDAIKVVVAKIAKAEKKEADKRYAFAPGLGRAIAIRGLLDIQKNQDEKLDRATRRTIDALLKKYEEQADIDVNDLKSGKPFNKNKKVYVGFELYRMTELITETENDNERQQTVLQSLKDKLNSDEFLKGLGTIGGEEILSYMLISQALCKNPGDKIWTRWNTKIKNLLHNIQNPDGTWTGQHCITSRTYCTAAALITLLTDQNDVMLLQQSKK